MTAKIISVTNRKGGCGKTTIAMPLGGTLSRHDRKVLIVDADPQGTATRWAASAEDERPFPARVAGLAAAGGKVHREVQKSVEDFDDIIVDGPPALDSPVPQSALMIADLAIVPIIPSPADLWAAAGIRELIERIGVVNEALIGRLLMNMWQPNTSLSRESLAVVEDFGIPVMASKRHLRTAYRQSAVFGATVHSLGREAQKAIDEVDRLVAEVVEILKD